MYAALIGASDDPPAANEARNGAIHLLSLSFTKIADGLVDPKLVLAWLLTTLGTPAALIGLLVPIREAGALLPQLALAQRVERAEARRRIWSLGSLLQGVSALAIAASALMLNGKAAGWAIIAALAVLSVSRALSSISYKDALARTIPKRRRGAITGAAASTAAAGVLTFGTLLALGILPLTVATVSGAIALAGALWLSASAIFLGLSEQAGDNAGTDEGPSLAALAEPLLTDAQLRRFIAARALLTATALAPPFILLLADSMDGAGLGTLGPFILASAGASILAGYVWGRLSDRSSRRTLLFSGLLAAGVLAIISGAGMVFGGLGSTLFAAGAVFVTQVAYEGVRAGRKLHLTDMTCDARRARYTALSNTLIGLVLLAGGALGALSSIIGPAAILGLLSLACLAALPVSWGLEEVQEGSD